MKNITLSLDQALHITGWCVFENKKISQFGHWEIPAKLPIEQRLTAVLQNLSTLHNQYDFNEIAFEDVQYQNNAETFKKLCFVQSAIIIWCYSNDVKFSILSPSHWRSVIRQKHSVSFGKKRNEQKQVSIDFVKNHFKKNVTEDEADAICLGYAYLLESNKQKSAF